MVSSRKVFVERSLYREPVGSAAFFILVIISFVQQIPWFQGEIYNIFRFAIYIAMVAILLYLVAKSNFKTINPLLIAISLLFLFVILTSLTTAIGGHKDFSSAMEIAIPLGILFCSLQVPMSKKLMSKFIFLYIILSVLLSICLIIKYNLSFQISEQYLVASKNQVGPLLAYGGILGIYELITENGYIGKRKWTVMACTSIILITIVMMRNRSSIIAIIAILMIIVVKKVFSSFSKKKLVISVLVIVSTAILLNFGIFNSVAKVITDSLFLNYDASDFNSLSANRTDIYIQALHFIKSNLLFGQLTSSVSFVSSYGHAHNYLINKLVQFGLIFAIPFVLFYLYLWMISIKDFVMAKKSRVSIILLFFALIVSLVEYTYPFGPGVSQFILWFMLGQEATKTSILKINS